VPTLDNNLGYRGFLLHNLTPGISPGAEAHVYNGIVIITDQGHPRAYPDSHGLEQWLIDQARAHGEADTLKAIGK
jgi:hypothetical protein